MKPRPSEDEFTELKRQRDEGIQWAVKAARKQLWPDAPDDGPVQFHCRDYHAGCYCACPDGPCQHEWNGPWKDFENGGSATCSRCGMDCMSHDIRVMP